MKVIEWDAKSLYLALKKAEALLVNIKSTGSHHQIKEKIDDYFKESKKELQVKDRKTKRRKRDRRNTSRRKSIGERRKDNASGDDCMITYRDPGDENEQQTKLLWSLTISSSL